MKQTGIIIIVVGLLITVFAGFRFVTKKKVVDIGKLEISRDENHVLDWSPLAGIVVMLVGGGVYLYGAKKG